MCSQVDSVVTVHGIKELFQQNTKDTTHLWAKLSQHVESINLLSFQYSWEVPQEGIALDDLREFANSLLEGLCQECVEFLPRTGEV